MTNKLVIFLKALLARRQNPKSKHIVIQSKPPVSQELEALLIEMAPNAHTRCHGVLFALSCSQVGQKRRTERHSNSGHVFNLPPFRVQAVFLEQVVNNFFLICCACAIINFRSLKMIRKVNLLSKGLPLDRGSSKQQSRGLVLQLAARAVCSSRLLSRLRGQADKRLDFEFCWGLTGVRPSQVPLRRHLAARISSEST